MRQPYVQDALHRRRGALEALSMEASFCDSRGAIVLSDQRNGAAGYTDDERSDREAATGHGGLSWAHRYYQGPPHSAHA